VPNLSKTLRANIPKQSHQFISNDVHKSYVHGIQPSFDHKRQQKISEKSLHTKYSHFHHKSPLSPEINSSMYSYQQSRQTIGPQYQLLPPSRAEYRPPPGQLYPKYHLSSLSPLSNDRLSNLQQRDYHESSQKLHSISESHEKLQHHVRRQDENRLPVNWEHTTTESQIKSHYRPEYRPVSRDQLEEHGLTAQHNPEYQNPTVRPDSESIAMTTAATSFNRQRFKQSTISPPYEHDAHHRSRYPDREGIRYRERPEPNRAHSGLSPHSLHAKDLVLHLIALNTPMNGNMRGVRGADLACYQQARQASFRTTFRAFLSSHVQDVNKVVYSGDRDTPIVNLRGERLFDSWGDIFQQRHMADVPIYSFNRRNVFVDSTWPEKRVWHGSDLFGMRGDSGYCSEWGSAASSEVGRSSIIGRGLPLLRDSGDSNCSRELIVLCIENMSKYNVERRLGKKRAYFDD
ncbi:unnamed protein product, partial [Cercopithifilaria johnstoni]